MLDLFHILGICTIRYISRWVKRCIIYNRCTILCSKVLYNVLILHVLDWY